MYGAWLERADGNWYLVCGPVTIDRVLDHDGRFVVCDTKADVSRTAKEIVAESGKYAESLYDKIYLSDVPIFNDLTEEAVNLAKNGVRCRIWNLRDYFRQEVINGKSVYWHAGSDIHNEEPKAGIVVVSTKHDDIGELRYGELRYDLELWNKCNTLTERRKRRKRENPEVNQEVMRQISCRFADKMGMDGPKHFLVGHFIVWILAHDQFFGRRETNKEIKWFAKKWLSNEVHKKRYSRWMTDDVLDKLEKRFKNALRRN